MSHFSVFIFQLYGQQKVTFSCQIFCGRIIIAMASSCVESEDSESDLEVENGSQAVLEFQKTDSLKKELEEEEMVRFCSIAFYRRNITL
jgi:hypothetical protein